MTKPLGSERRPRVPGSHPSAPALAAGRTARLRTPRLVLEPLEPGHARRLFPELSDPRIYRYFADEPPVSTAALRKRFERYVRGTRLSGPLRGRNWAVRTRAGRAWIGTMQATLDVRRRQAFVAYLLVPARWGHGYGSEGVRAVLRSLRDRDGIETIEALVDARNRRSIHLLVGLGFRRVATRRRAEFFKGRWSDEYRYRLAPSPKRATSPRRRQGV